MGYATKRHPSDLRIVIFHPQYLPHYAKPTMNFCKSRQQAIRSLKRSSTLSRLT
ncbi:Uncharacterised protein [Vibrio cholerae]|nr:Uncharacterised protein [Vibrio cholerae]